MKADYRWQRGASDGSTGFRHYFHFLLETSENLLYNPDRMESHEGFDTTEIEKHTVDDLENVLTNIIRFSLTETKQSELDTSLIRQMAWNVTEEWFNEFYPVGEGEEKNWYLHFVDSENFYKNIKKILNKNTNYYGKD